MMHLFIDSNIYLDFYRYSKDDLEELKKLIVLIEEGALTLYIPQIVIQEVWRNREKTLSDALRRIYEKHQKFNLNFPNFVRSDYGDLVDVYYTVLKELSKNFNLLLERVNDDILNKNLSADRIISEIFKKGRVLETNNFNTEIYKRAKFRIDTGQPPAEIGKCNTLGDCLIWESLLEATPSGVDLYFVTQDQDFKSSFNNNKFSEFLRAEWLNKKDSGIIFYPNLSSFFEDHFPQIRVAEELRKEVLISKLMSSSSFRETHEIISKLLTYEEFTKDQRNRIINAVTTNNQIYWIIDDMDVKEFVKNIVEGYEHEIEEESLEKVYKLLPDLQNGLPF